MGIRYYAYAFDPDETEAALADPMSVIGEDPLADAWGLEPGFTMGVTNYEQSLPERDLLYLDKAWPHLQQVTRSPSSPGAPRVSHQMFEGGVKHTDMGWIPWARAISPARAADIARDLKTITAAEVEAVAKEMTDSPEDCATEFDYALEFLRKAQEFATGVAEDGRGFAYTIG